MVIEISVMYVDSKSLSPWSFFPSIWFPVRSAIQKSAREWEARRKPNLSKLLNYIWAVYTWTCILAALCVRKGGQVWSTLWKKPKKKLPEHPLCESVALKTLKISVVKVQTKNQQ